MAFYNNTYMPNQGGGYYGQSMQNMQAMQSMQPMQGMQQPMQRQEQYMPQQQNFNTNIGLQGKSVDSVDVVKAMDIPLDGSISYFPLADGSAIVTKQLQQDGTSKTVIYRPSEEKENTVKAKEYVTPEQLEERVKKINNNDIKEELKNIKKQLKDMQRDIDYLNEERKD